MRVADLCLTVLVIAGLAGSQQEQQTQEQPPQHPEQQERQQQQRRRPTLGAAPAPSLYGPRTSNTTDARKLLRVRRIYIERIDNSLSEKLVEGFAKTRRFRIVASRGEADAILRGSCVNLRRMKSVHSEVYLNDMNGAAIWQDNVRRPYNPPTLQAAVSETAGLIVTHLTESALEAEHR